MSQCTTISSLKRLGIEGLSFNEGESPYYKLMSSILTTYPHLNEYFGLRGIVSGSGWSTVLGKTYTITFEGIQAVLQILRVNAIVTESLAEIKKQCLGLKEGERLAFVTEGRDSSKHAISLFARKKRGILQITINDSLGYHISFAETLRETLATTVQIFGSKVLRQQEGEVTCNAFAITDCVAFHQDRELMDKIIARSDATLFAEDVHAIRKLPYSLMTLQYPMEARKEALKHQAMLIEVAMEEANPGSQITCRSKSSICNWLFEALNVYLNLSFQK